MFVAFTLIIFLGAMVFQTSDLLEFIKIGEIKPDLILILVVWLGLVKGSDAGCFSGFFFGLFEDASSNMTLGSNALTKTILGFFCGLSGKRLYTQSFFSHVVCVGIGSVVDIVVLLSIHGFVPNWKRLLLYRTVYNIVCCPFMVYILRSGEQRLSASPSSSSLSR